MLRLTPVATLTLRRSVNAGLAAHKPVLVHASLDWFLILHASSIP